MGLQSPSGNLLLPGLPGNPASQPCHGPGWPSIDLARKTLVIRYPPPRVEVTNVRVREPEPRAAGRSSPSLFLRQEKPFVPGT